MDGLFAAVSYFLTCAVVDVKTCVGEVDIGRVANYLAVADYAENKLALLGFVQIPVTFDCDFDWTVYRCRSLVFTAGGGRILHK